LTVQLSPSGGLVLPCVLDMLHQDKPRLGALGLDSFLSLRHRHSPASTLNNPESS
ncbi:hypothetical protein BHM03_00046021, partial [Ensete ventricosum]